MRIVGVASRSAGIVSEWQSSTAFC